MMHLVTGGSGSGKSAYAESLILASGEKRRIYVATMIPFGEEGNQRVERHRRMRREKQFETVERYVNLAGLNFRKLSGTDLEKTAGQKDTEPDSMKAEVQNFQETAGAVLLECVSNLTANEMYGENGAGIHTVSAVLEGIRRLRRQAGTLVVVTNEVFSDGITYDDSTMQYLIYLGEINRELAAMADCVTEVVYGIPVQIKG